MYGGVVIPTGEEPSGDCLAGEEAAARIAHSICCNAKLKNFSVFGLLGNAVWPKAIWLQILELGG